MAEITTVQRTLWEISHLDLGEQVQDLPTGYRKKVLASEVRLTPHIVIGSVVRPAQPDEMRPVVARSEVDAQLMHLHGSPSSARYVAQKEAIGGAVMDALFVQQEPPRRVRRRAEGPEKEERVGFPVEALQQQILDDYEGELHLRRMQRFVEGQTQITWCWFVTWTEGAPGGQLGGAVTVDAEFLDEALALVAAELASRKRRRPQQPPQ